MAKRYLILTINSPRPEVDQASFDTWYDGQLAKIREVPGVLTARRYRPVQKKGTDHEHIAAYEVETDDIEAFKAAMNQRLQPLETQFDQATSIALIGEAID